MSSADITQARARTSAQELFSPHPRKVLRSVPPVEGVEEEQEDVESVEEDRRGQ